jgi:hypothetical protein
MPDLTRMEQNIVEEMLFLKLLATDINWLSIFETEEKYFTKKRYSYSNAITLLNSMYICDTNKMTGTYVLHECPIYDEQKDRYG